jgi:hypothetical protein
VLSRDNENGRPSIHDADVAERLGPGPSSFVVGIMVLAHRDVAQIVVMPHLIQILLPIYDNFGSRFPPDVYAQVRSDLTQRFGGLTAYSRAPAEGVWTSGTGIKEDDIVVLEVMVDELERSWWSDYRLQLQKLFRQEHIVIRAQIYEAL